MKIGIIQGRLLPPVDGFIQEFPTHTWRQEFSMLTHIGLDHIEFIVTKKSFSDFLNLPLLDFVDKISSICCDNIIDSDFHKMSFLKSQLVPICNVASKFGIVNINIPLLEDSSLTIDNFDEFSENILSLSSDFPNLKFNFELESSLETSLSLVNLSDRFKFVYDTGNLNFIGVNHCDYLNGIIHKISNVHLKDRDSKGSHFPNEGSTDFKSIFEILYMKNYDGYFTIQTKRGGYGNEMDTISKHSDYFKTLWKSFDINKYE